MSERAVFQESSGTPAGEVFLVEDDPEIGNLIRIHLERACFEVTVFRSADPVIPQGLKQPPGLFILDIMLPDADGRDLCRQIRITPRLADIPVMFLTAKSSEADRLQAFEAGADDFITKPFSPRELIARVRAVLRRADAEPVVPVITTEDFIIDLSALTVRRSDGDVLPTTATEFRLLAHLACRPGVVLSRNQLLDAVWGESVFVTARVVDVYIGRLRRRLEKDPENPEYLTTVRGLGYRFNSKRK